ncbi:hypothetical protein INT48_001992 [Thamnidium elegans]|uniref:PHD-type domain-containing protein n=1 Tax=Thamnidium elegans TaxID=101142 RepID=A0A8H7SZA5_9FUNG|nr:hypothetical protein INT48_001992 [Thamnidium elegans]
MKSKKSTPTPTPTDHKRTKRKTMHDSNTTVNINNHDVCDACGGHGQFLCCDACPNAFHFTCVEPPLTCDDVKKLKGNWYCNECKPRKTKRTQDERSYTGLFLPLIENIKSKNPKTFRLPSSIAQHFKGVSSDKQGRYVDTSRIKPARYKREVRDPSATTIITTNDENRIPPSTFSQGLSILIEKELKELEDNKHVNNKPPKKVKTEDVIVSKTGTVYRLPVNPIKLNFSNYIETRA